MPFGSKPVPAARPTRRDLLKALPLATATLWTACRQAPPYGRSDFVIPARSPVGLFPAAGYDVDFGDVIGRGLEELGVAVSGRRVLLKPNLVEYAPGTAINTHPLVVAGAATAFLRAGAREVVVREGPGHRRDIEYLLAASGHGEHDDEGVALDEHLRDIRVRFVDLNHDDVRLTPLRSRFMGLAAVDATCARTIGFDPAKIGYLATASEFLGHIDPALIDQRGEAPARYRARFDVLDSFKPIQLASAG